MNDETKRSRLIARLDALFQKAEQFHKQKNIPQAINAYVHLIFQAPRHWMAYYKLGMILGNLKRREAAIVALQRAVDIKPDEPGLWVSLGVLFRQCGHHELAYEAFQNALQHEPKHLHALFNLGEMLLRTNRPDEALEYFEIILAGDQDADHIKAISRWLRGVAKLTQGRYLDAWEDYESRIHHPTTTFPELIGERWTGQPVKGKKIFLAYEQRFGDVIQFVRFVPKLVEMGAEVYLQTPPQLMRLFHCLGDGIHLVGLRASLPEYDYCQLVTSIPALLRYTQDQVGDTPYLNTEPDAPAIKLPARHDTHLKVGLIWAGKPVPDRSIPLEHYIPLLRHRQVSFYSLQLGPARKDMKKHAVDWLIHDLAGNIHDFHDSSLLMQAMDLVITIDTAAAHQAGALGVPTWLMLRHYSCWRWGPPPDMATPWYPSIKMIRQDHPGSWEAAAKQLDADFAEWVEASSSDQHSTAS